MGIKVLKSNLGSGDTFLTKNLTLSAPVYYQCDFWIPSATLTVLDGGAFSLADILELDVEADDGVFGGRPGLVGTIWEYVTYGGAPFSGVAITPDAWHTLAAHYTGTHVYWTADGTPLADYDVTLSLDGINSAGQFGADQTGEIYYSDNYRVGTSAGAGDIFCSDFEVGDLSEWSSVTGSGSSVVNDPLGTGGPTGSCASVPFSLAAVPSSFSESFGFAGALHSTITSTLLSGAPESIALTVPGGPPSGVTSVIFTPSTITDDGGTSDCSINLDGSLVIGGYTITARGDDGAGGVATVPIDLTIATPPPGFHIAS